jgi:hypothetical protein
LAALPLAEAGPPTRSAGLRIAAVAILVLVAALVRGWARLLPVSIVLLGGIYAAHLRVDHVTLDLRAPAFAAGLLVTAELGYWSIEERERFQGEPGDGIRQLSVIAVLAAAGVLAGAAVLALADVARTGGLVVDLLGAAAAASLLISVALLARR